MTEVVTDDAIAQLTAVLGTDLPAQTLKVLLVRSGGDVSAAVQSYFDNPGADFSNESVFQPPAPAAAVGDDVLGTLFKSSAYRKQETDLAIIITPHLVEPTSPGDRLRTPHDATHAPNDVDLFLFGKDEVKASTARTSITVDGKMIDYPIVDRAERLLALAARIEAKAKRA